MVMRILMMPGWLQKIATQQPDASQIEVAVASFRELLREAEATGPIDSRAPTELGKVVASADPCADDAVPP